VSSPEQMIDWSVQAGSGIYHAIGSAVMGPSDDDVVDSELRVRGVDALRVVDASVFRAQSADNSAAPTMALAWRAADLIGG
jgi:choline dehydrogenase